MATSVVLEGARHTVAERRRAPGWVLFMVCAAIFMLMLDATIVSAALADIRNDFDASIDGLQWVVDAYVLPLAGLLLTFATLGDRYGRKRIFVGGMVVFTGSSLVLALSRNVVQLDVLRAVQGAGAAMLFATALPLLAAAYPDRAARLKAIGIYGAVMAGASVAGPVLGGALVTSFGWRSIFTVNVPLGIVIVALALTRMPETARGQRRTDWLGSMLLTGGLVGGVFSLTRGNALGWTSAELLGLAGGSVLLLAAFLAWQFRAAQPMFDVSMLRKPGFAGTAIVSVVHMATMMAASNYLALYLVNTQGYTPLQMGLRLLPISVAALATAPIAAVLSKRIPAAVALPVTMGLVALGMWLMSDYSADHSWTYFVPGMVIAGIGLGAITAVSQATALTFAPDGDAGMASATFGTLRQLGMAIGVAGLGAMFGHVARTEATDALAAAHLPDALGGPFADAVAAGAGTQVIAEIPHEFLSAGPLLADAATAASTTALNALTGLGATIGAIGAAAAALAFLLGRRG
ncbi:MFS transporter [Nocardia sp. NPDC052566]|uniref:MFS transporter n=1 Tax=Nocardia sp. NPDC052566 TaxID=3364330 RepID=UPI0037C7C9FB